MAKWSSAEWGSDPIETSEGNTMKQQEASGMARQYRLTRQMEESTRRQSEVTGRLLALKSSTR